MHDAKHALDHRKNMQESLWRLWGSSAEAHRKLPKARVGEGERFAQGEGGGQKQVVSFFCLPPPGLNPRTLRRLSGLEAFRRDRWGLGSGGEVRNLGSKLLPELPNLL